MTAPPGFAPQLRTMLELIPNPVMVVDAQTLEYVDGNAAAFELLGWTREQVLSVPGAASRNSGVAPPVLRAHYAELIERAPREVEGVTVAARPDGSVVEVDVHRRAFELDGRWYVLLRCEIARMHDAAQAGAELARHHALVRQSGHAMLMMDYRTRRCLDASEPACALLGCSREALLGMTPAAVFGLDDEQLARRWGDMVVHSPELAVEDVVIELAPGRRVDAQVTSYAILADAQWLVIATLQDRTVQRALERDLMRLRLAIEQAADSVHIIDAHTCEYLYVNQTACRRVGLIHEEHMRMRPWEVDAVLGTRERTLALHRELIERSPQVQTSEVEIRHASGALLPMEVSRSAMSLDGRWIVLVTGHDISDRRQAEAELKRHLQDLERFNRELERSNQELERFAYVASHDLSEPLRMVASYTQLLERRYGPKLDDEAREFIGFAVDGARRMKRLIDDLLTYSRAGRADKPLREVDMNAVFADALKNLEQLIADKGATVECGELPRVQGDATALEQLMQNLVGNAIKFVGGRAPVVRVLAERGVGDDAGTGPGEWTVRVQDNGVGIEPQYFNRIFELFQRLHTQDKFQGTGLGLAICKKIVDRHGGRIWVESVPGEGSTFSFTLPAPQPAGA